MLVFELPTGLELVVHGELSGVHTWGGTHDAAVRSQVLEACPLPADASGRFEWFAICVRCRVGKSRALRMNQMPDVDNVAKLILDAFTGHLYADDDATHVRGVQVEADWAQDDQERTEIWIYGRRK